MDFELQTDLTVYDQPIIFNFDELNAWLTAELADMKGLIVQEDEISFAKDKRAKINKIAKAIDEQRLAVKKKFMTAYEPFEAQCKQLAAVCKDASAALDSQIKAFEEQKKAQKEQALKDAYASLCPDEIKPFLPWNRVFNSRWLNATYKQEDAENEIKAAVEQKQKDIEAIRGLGSQFEAALLEAYAGGQDLAGVLALNVKLAARQAEEERRREELERQRQEAERRRLEAEAQKARQERESVLDEIPVEAVPLSPAETVKAVEAAMKGEEVKEQETVYSFRLEISGKLEDLKALKAFLVERNLTYRKI